MIERLIDQSSMLRSAALIVTLSGAGLVASPQQPSVLECGDPATRHTTTAVVQKDGVGGTAADAIENAIAQMKIQLVTSMFPSICSFCTEGEPRFWQQCDMRIIIDSDPGGDVTCTTPVQVLPNIWETTCQLALGSEVFFKCQPCP